MTRVKHLHLCRLKVQTHTSIIGEMDRDMTVHMALWVDFCLFFIDRLWLSFEPQYDCNNYGTKASLSMILSLTAWAIGISYIHLATCQRSWNRPRAYKWARLDLLSVRKEIISNLTKLYNFSLMNAPQINSR